MDRRIVHAFFWVASTDIDSNHYQLERNIKLLTEKGIWFVQHGIFLRNDNNNTPVSEFNESEEYEEIYRQLAEYLNSLTASLRQKIYDIWSGVKSWDTTYNSNVNKLTPRYVKQKFWFLIQEYHKHGAEMDLTIPHYVELSLELYDNCDRIIRELRRSKLLRDESNYALKLVDKGNDKEVDVAKSVNKESLNIFWRGGSLACPVPFAVHIRCTKKVGHADKKFCVVQQIKYMVSFPDISNAINIENIFYNCLSEPVEDHAHTDLDHDAMLLINAEDRKILNTHTKELRGRPARARESPSGRGFAWDWDDLFKHGEMNNRKNKKKA